MSIRAHIMSRLLQGCEYFIAEISENVRKKLKARKYYQRAKVSTSEISKVRRGYGVFYGCKNQIVRERNALRQVKRVSYF